ncbi:protein of unknown function (plasmid) [Lactiplantibacillus plantarum]
MFNLNFTIYLKIKHSHYIVPNKKITDESTNDDNGYFLTNFLF